MSRLRPPGRAAVSRAGRSLASYVGRSGRRGVALVVAVAVLATLVVVLWPGAETRSGTAFFTRAVGLYQGSDVRVLGVKVGQVRRVRPEGDRVRVDFVYDAKYKVPADAKAVIISPSVVSDRYVQLTPAYTTGPVLADGARIPLHQTAVPVELDRIFASLNDLDVALGPQGANKDGALSRLLAVGADNLDGEGAAMKSTVTDLSQALSTLARGKEDLFGTVDNLQVFTTALAHSDSQVAAFNQDLASVADQLAGERQELALALKNLAVALGEVAAFVKENEKNLTGDIRGLAAISGTLAKQKDAIAEVLDAGPVALSNLQLAYNASSGTLDTRDNAEQLADPALYLCSLLTSLGQPRSVCNQVRKVLDGVRLPEPGQPPRLPSGGGPDLTLGGVLGTGH
jgi:phospholipid/cholesterol/gamma-HCH transport system substrate-binding protein